jgi:hypothetical protein
VQFSVGLTFGMSAPEKIGSPRRHEGRAAGCFALAVIALGVPR